LPRRNVSRGAKHSIGIEIEKASFEANALISSVALYKMTGWVKEFDNSVTRGGFELVSPRLPAMSCNSHLEMFYDFFPELIDAEVDSTCGFHVHVSGRGVLNGFISWAPLLYAMYPYRLNNHYCMARGGQLNSNRYSGIRLVDEDSEHIELRMFPGCKDKEQLMWRIKLIQIILKNLNASEKDVYKMLLSNTQLRKHVSKVYVKRFHFLLERFKIFSNAFNGTDFKCSITIEEMIQMLGIRPSGAMDLLNEILNAPHLSESYRKQVMVIQARVFANQVKYDVDDDDPDPSPPTPATPLPITTEVAGSSSYFSSSRRDRRAVRVRLTNGVTTEFNVQDADVAQSFRDLFIPDPRLTHGAPSQEAVQGDTN
jgi:hypothetical protein